MQCLEGFCLSSPPPPTSKNIPLSLLRNADFTIHIDDININATKLGKSWKFCFILRSYEENKYMNEYN